MDDVIAAVNDQLLTPGDLALRWQKPKAWIYSNWRRIGLEPVHVGKALRFRPEDIRSWEMENTTRKPARSSGALLFHLWRR